MNSEDVIKEYVSSGKTRMMQIATSADGQPWCCTVYYAVDEDLNLIWISKPSARHSQEIAQNPKVAGTIAYNQQPPNKIVRGVQFEGVAELLQGDDESQAAQYFVEQMQREDPLLEDIRSGKNPHKVYRIKVNKFVLFDRENFPDKERQEWEPHV